MSDPFDLEGGLDERFADWVDGRLTPLELRRLEEEMDADDALRQMAMSYRATVALLQEHLDDEDPPRTFVSDVFAAIAADSPRRRWIPITASLCAAAAMIYIFVELSSLTGSHDDSGQLVDEVVDVRFGVRQREEHRRGKASRPH